MTTLRKLSIAAAFTVAMCGTAAAQGLGQWQRVAPAGAGFTVQMPGTPEASTQSVPTVLGSLDMHTLLYVKGNEGYFVAYATIPGAASTRVDSEKILNGARDGAFKNGRILSESSSTLSGYPARTIVGTAGQFNAILKICLVNGKLYQALYLSTGQPSASSAASFFDSFSLSRYDSR